MTQLCLVSGAGARSRKEAEGEEMERKRTGARWEFGQVSWVGAKSWGRCIGDVLSRQHQCVLSSSPVFPCASVWGGMWRGQVSAQRVLLVQQERQAVAELARDGLLVRCSPLPLETSEWVPETGILAASHEVGRLPNPKGMRCLVSCLHVPHGCNGKMKGGQTPAGKNCRHFSTL